VECFTRIENELPCYNQRGEPYYPPTDKAKREELLQKKKTAVVSTVSGSVSDTDSTDTTASAATTDSTAPEEPLELTGQPIAKETGSVFHPWV
jgi:hypothetical protein